MSTDSVTRREIVVQLANGLHLRPASLIARVVVNSQCDVTVNNGERTADAKSPLELVGLNAPAGSKLTLESRGEGSADVLEAIIPFFEVDDHTDPSVEQQ